ncbi:MAG: metallophosphoesterase family protein [Planctomycetes bacterium]|nr:metallophosphoesterase family protein [Planctomycetota bacterium]
MTYPRTAVISDLHGNMPALEVCLADARERGVTRVVCCGDVVGYGAQPREALDLVMRLCVPAASWPDGAPLAPGLCLRGNHEEALLSSAEDFNPKARAAIDWTRQEISEGGGRERGYDYWDFLGDLLPAQVDDVAMFAHGSPREPVREYLLPRDITDPAKMRGCFEAMRRDVCFVGHSHVAAVYYEDGRLYQPKDTEGPYSLDLGPGRRAIVNVGSVGQPRDGDPRLSYVIFDGATVQFVRLDYDHEAAAARIRAVPDLPDYLADRLAQGR